MEEIDPTSITPLTDGQEVLLSVLGVISATLSVLGSGTIIFKIVHNLYRASPYDRLLLALSTCDIIASITFALSPVLLSKETSQRAWASGNDATTNMLGFFTQFSFSAILYNGMLSYYYLLTVRFGVKRKEFTEKYEKWMHIITLSFFLITATVGAIMGFYNEVEISQGAWVANWPEGCEATDSCMSQYIGLIYAALPTIFTFVSLIVNNTVIYFYVRRKLDVVQAPGSMHDSMGCVDTHTDVTSLSRGTVPLPQSPTLPIPVNQDAPQSPNSVRPVGITLANANDKFNTSLSSFRTWDSSNNSRRGPSRAATPHVREVATQGLLYVGAFLVSYTAGGILRTLEVLDYTASDEGKIYWLLVLDAFLKPLQGFLNVFVYSRPNYARFRLNNPEKGRLWAIRKACLDPDIPRLPRPFSNGQNCVGFEQPSLSGQTRQDVYMSNLASVRETGDELEFESSLDALQQVEEGEPTEGNSTSSSPPEECGSRRVPSRFS